MPRPPEKTESAHTAEVTLACTALHELLEHLASLGRLGGGAVTEGLLQAAADDCPDAVFVADKHARIVMVNGVAARMLGQSTRALQALTVWDIMHVSSQPDFDVLWKELLRAGRQRGVYSLRHHNGDAVTGAYCSRCDVLPDRHVSVVRRLDR